MIHKNERSNHAALPEGKYTLYRHAFADGCLAGFNDNIEHSKPVSAKLMGCTPLDRIPYKA
jgi:hypothetical protein